ncbi:growth hormone receptor-like isoform X2 [Pungitius pungitius]|uniref:growth hormone receptor-like isoform X2 n=1 Tax=Pungitius pungitius TaxID=134920 RepID=UPI002E0F2C1D
MRRGALLNGPVVSGSRVGWQAAGFKCWVGVGRSSGGGRMPRLLRLLLCLLPLVAGGGAEVPDATYQERHGPVVAATTRPHIHLCRSPNMEDFSCWWRPLDNLTDGEQVTYDLRYSHGNGPWLECPDYVSSGPFSCHFDSRHTSIWKPYCLKVSALTPHGNYTSQKLCVDVADIVQTEAPVNLSFSLKDAGGDEVGHAALLSWSYPVPSDLRYGWITLVYELQYRRLTEPDAWKVKHPLREPRVVLLGLPVGDYAVRVRCRSQNNGIWSAWSAAITMSLPAGRLQGNLLVVILVTGVGVVALLGILFLVVPQGKRIKNYFLPPVPKPRIIGIDPLLLKKGNLDEINRHFSSFHSFSPPSYAEDVWVQVSGADVFLAPPKVPTGRGNVAPCEQMPPPQQQMTSRPPSYIQSVLPNCSSLPQADAPFTWSTPEVVSLPGSGYSVMGRPAPPGTAPLPPGATSRSPQDFYTCVQLMSESGEVHLVPCLPPAYCREAPPLPKGVGKKKGVEQQEQVEQQDQEEEELAGRRARTHQREDGGEGEGSEAAPLLPVAGGNQA